MIYAGIVTSDMKRRHKVHVREFYRDLLHCCDDHGRFEADPALLRAVLYQSILDRVSVRDVQSYLHALHLAGDVKLYTVRGRGYGKVTKWRQTRLTKLVAEYPPEEGEPELFGAESPPAAPPGAPKKERKKEVSARGAKRPAPHDTRLAELCLDELRERWPRHDLAACLRRALRYVRSSRGEDANVTVEWFETHWLPNESERKEEFRAPPTRPAPIDEAAAHAAMEAERARFAAMPEPEKGTLEHALWTEARRTA